MNDTTLTQEELNTLIEREDIVNLQKYLKLLKKYDEILTKERRMIRNQITQIENFEIL